MVLLLLGQGEDAIHDELGEGEPVEDLFIRGIEYSEYWLQLPYLRRQHFQSVKMMTLRESSWNARLSNGRTHSMQGRYNLHSNL